MFSREKVELFIGSISSFFLSLDSLISFDSFDGLSLEDLSLSSLSYCDLISSLGLSFASFSSSSRVGIDREFLSADSRSSSFGVSGRLRPFKSSSNSLVSASLGILGSLSTSEFEVRPNIFYGLKLLSVDESFF
jgi:hypothetical protein